MERAGGMGEGKAAAAGPELITPDLLRAIRRQVLLPWRGLHGVVHWARVLENGLRLAAVTGARRDVVALFAVFHDAGRWNDGSDPQHGRRGADLARALHGPLFQLADVGLDLLCTACEHHTHGRTHDDVTVRTCWDADRLDLGRVGKTPDPRQLCTDAARAPDLIAWALQRSQQDHVPDVVESAWAGV